MPKITIRIEANNFAKLAAQLRPDLQTAKADAADQVKLHAQNLAPVQSGDLRDSIHIQQDGLDYAIIAGAYYAHFLEFGTRHAPAHPFMKPARDLARPPFEDAISRILK